MESSTARTQRKPRPQVRPGFTVAVLAAALTACGSNDQPPPEDESSTGAVAVSSSTTGTTEVVPASTSTSTSSETATDSEPGIEPTDTAPTTTDDPMGGECSLYEQDCGAGEKCVPWSDQPDLTPDDIRCCPIIGEPKEIGDECTVDGYFGSCLDDCNTGSFCMDLDGDGTGVCQAMCRGNASDPVCEADQSCLIYFAGVPLCFDECDPLVQDCPDGEGCYPDDAAAGGTGFICLPTIGTGGYGDYCWLLSNCQPGFICVTGDFLPDCNGLVGCCTALCDTTEPDDCDAFAPEIQCIDWYFGGQMPPSVGLEDVGACALPP